MFVISRFIPLFCHVSLTKYYIVDVFQVKSANSFKRKMSQKKSRILGVAKSHRIPVEGARDVKGEE